MTANRGNGPNRGSGRATNVNVDLGQSRSSVSGWTIVAAAIGVAGMAAAGWQLSSRIPTWSVSFLIVAGGVSGLILALGVSYPKIHAAIAGTRRTQLVQLEPYAVDRDDNEMAYKLRHLGATSAAALEAATPALPAAHQPKQLPTADRRRELPG